MNIKTMLRINIKVLFHFFDTLGLFGLRIVKKLLTPFVKVFIARFKLFIGGTNRFQYRSSKVDQRLDLEFVHETQ